MNEDLEKALIIYKESKNSFEKINKQLKELRQALLNFTLAMETANKYLRRALNEEKNGGNVHKKCQWYNAEKDYCKYVIGKFTGLAFEVSKVDKCIVDVIKEHEKSE